MKANKSTKTEEKIIAVLDELRPYLNSDGGDIEFIKYEDNVVFVKLSGGCACCAHRNETLQNSILVALQSEIPEIKDIINVEL